jgi:hypothetical protein
MGKRKVGREGVIVVNFPPPAPDDLDTQLHWAVEDLLGAAGECAAAADPDDNGWLLDVRIADPGATAAWADRLITLLRKRKVARQSTMALSVRAGPMEVAVYSRGDHADWSPLLPAGGEKASADVFIEIPGRVVNRDRVLPNCAAWWKEQAKWSRRSMPGREFPQRCACMTFGTSHPLSGLCATS